MKKKFTIVLFVFLLCIGTSFSVFASQGVFSDEHDRLTDWADLLTDSEESELSAMLDEISQRQKMDVAIATVNNLDGYSTATEYADALYEFFNYGYSEEKNGILLLISMENRDWAISTCGLGKTYLRTPVLITSANKSGPIFQTATILKSSLLLQNFATSLSHKRQKTYPMTPGIFRASHCR